MLWRLRILILDFYSSKKLNRGNSTMAPRPAMTPSKRPINFHFLKE